MEDLNVTLRKKVRQQEGFSLIELLIVIAIMGVLAVIAFNAFNGVLQNSKKRADEQQAGNIVKAIRLLITDSGYSDLVTDTAKFNTSVDSGTTLVPCTFALDGQAGVNQLIIALQGVIYVADPMTSVVRGFGPFLTNPNGSIVSEKPYFPQWNVNNGGKNTGYLFEISKASFNVRGIPVSGDDSTAHQVFVAPLTSATTDFQSDKPCGFIINP